MWDSADWTLSEEDFEGDDDINIDDIIEWNEAVSKMSFKPRNLFRELATGTGIGLRYDLGFLVIRVDWGFAIHNPELDLLDERNGYFNPGSFKDMQTLHFAIGYPF